MAIWRVCVCVRVLYMVFVRTREERREAVCVFKGLKSPSCSKSPLSTWPRPPHYHHQHHQYHHQRQHQQNVAYSDNLHVHKVDRRWKHSSHRSIKRVFRGADWIQGWNWSRTLAQIAGTSLGSRYWPQLVFLSVRKWYKRIGDFDLVLNIFVWWPWSVELIPAGVHKKHCQRHYGPRRSLLWPVSLVW